ncbi:unnamed protein product [Hymenolepis diminuta]|uniref:CTNNB1_binding domain-containing protein n=1 Tax=Hymenolepis diminuta TaxID=6216 RepID=A0A0R3SWU5_HYMDI|nr:unnamed protein product [Hymenolepis diminuta]
MNSVSEDDLACTDEIRVYEDEGEEDEQVKSSENLTEDKVGLVIESEEQHLVKESEAQTQNPDIHCNFAFIN